MNWLLLVYALALSITGCATSGSKEWEENDVVTFRAIPPQSVQTLRLRDVRYRRFADENTYNSSEWTSEPSIWPINPSQCEVISRFGPRGRSRKMHNGIDIKAERGTPIVATADGEVAFVGRRSGYGNFILLTHGEGVATAYGHFDELWVAQGDIVRQGTPIGSVGATGNASTPHVHYEILIDDQPHDPWLFLPAITP